MALGNGEYCSVWTELFPKAYKQYLVDYSEFKVDLNIQL